MSVLLLPPIFQFFDNNGDPLANGFVDTFAAGTNTRLATFTDSTGITPAPNPIELDPAGRPNSGSGAIWGEGAYKFIVRNSAGVQVGSTLDNVISFNALSAAEAAYAETFSGNGVQTVFTTSQGLGTEEKGLLVSVASGLQEIAVNGSFAADTNWTKGAGWTIAAGVATATGAISTALSQVPVISLVIGQAYAVTYTITRSAGGLIPSLGGYSGVERTASGTYREIIIAANTTPISFTGNAFTGTLDNVSITAAVNQPMALQPVSAYTINGTSLTFASAPPLGINNIDVRAPTTLLGAASAAATLAQAYAANAATSATNAATSATAAAGSATSAAAFASKNKWLYSNNPAMANPSTANVRFNNTTLNLSTQIAISDLSANTGNPDLGTWISTWDDATGSNRGTIYIFKDEANFLLFLVNGATTDNSTWWQLPVTNIASAGTIANGDALYFGFTANGTTTVTGGITALTGDVSASGTGSVATTLATVNANVGSFTNASVTVDGKGRVTAASTGAPGIPTGVIWDFDGAEGSVPTGWLLCSGKTIGSASSGATARANADTQALFNLMWSDQTNATRPIFTSAGGASSRGASAAADWAANMRMTIADDRGMVSVGKDDMGGTAANRITSAISGIVGTLLGTIGGDQRQQSHTHTATVSDSGHTHNTPTYAGASFVAGSVSGNGGGSPGSFNTGSAATGITVTNASTGAGSSQNVQPSMIRNRIIKL